MTQNLPETGINLDAYFQRIGYDGGHAPTLATLRAILLRHTATIPFENLTPFLKQPVRLDPAALQQKLIEQGRGGYCFEQNLLLRGVLTTLGFAVTSLAARVLWNVPEGVVTARGHMLLLVEVEARPYVVDVGFGGLTLTAPLALAPDVEQRTSHEPFRVIADGTTYIMQARIGQVWKPLYRFDLNAQQMPDYEVTNWYLSNHPNSHFVTSLIAARPDAGRRYALRNNQLAIHDGDGNTERRVLTTVAELRAALEEMFRITLPDTPELDPALQRLIDQSRESVS